MIENLPSIVTIITTLDDNSGMGMHNNIKINGLRVHLETLGEEIKLWNIYNYLHIRIRVDRGNNIQWRYTFVTRYYCLLSRDM